VNKVARSVFDVAYVALLVEAVSEKVTVVLVSLSLCLKHKQLNEKFKQASVHVRIERVGRDLVHVTTRFDSISWFRGWWCLFCLQLNTIG